MTNETKTRRLIVTLHEVSGEEVDTLISDIEQVIQMDHVPSFAVRHALGESLPVGLRIVVVRDRLSLIMGSTLLLSLNQHNTRAVAGALLAAADQLAEGTQT